MKIFSKITLLVILFQIFPIFGASADSKTDILKQVSTLEENISLEKKALLDSLRSKVISLGDEYNLIISSGNYNPGAVEYLVSLGKLSSNFIKDLSNENTLLSNEIKESFDTQVNKLDALSTEISLGGNISPTQQANFEKKIKDIAQSGENIQDTFQNKVIAFQNKHTSLLSSYKESLKNAYNSNQSTLQDINNFSGEYEKLFKVYQDFSKNYEEFKNSYLAFAGDLTIFSETKQKYYVEELQKELLRVRDLNIESTKGLQDYKGEFDRLIEILLQNFDNSLLLHINESYGILYSDTDIKSLQTGFNTLTNRYFDLDGNLKPKEVLSNTGALEDIKYHTLKLDEINKKIQNLLGDNKSSNTYENVKIRLENQMIRYYNDNYRSYRDDLMERMKEKLNYISLQIQTTVLMADAIDIRYAQLNDKISKSNDFTFINNEIAKFKKDIQKYRLMENSVLDTKIQNLEINLDIFYIGKELSQFKYTKFKKESAIAQLTPLLNKVKTHFPNNYKEKLQIVLQRVDIAGDKKLSDKNRFMLLVLKLETLKFIKN